MPHLRVETVKAQGENRVLRFGISSRAPVHLLTRAKQRTGGLSPPCYLYGNTRTIKAVCAGQGKGTVLLKFGSIAGVQFGSWAGARNVGTGVLIEGSVLRTSTVSEAVWITETEGV